MVTDIHVIVKKKDTFDVFDYPYAVVLTVYGSMYTINYYSDAAHTGSVTTDTYTTADHRVYAIPNE